MQLGFLHVFAGANKGPKTCAMCGVDIPHKKAFVHHFKTDRKIAGDEIGRFKPNKPMNKAWAYYTHQLYFCSEACVVLKGLDGVYEERK